MHYTLETLIMNIWDTIYPHINATRLQIRTSCQSQAGYGAHLRLLKHKVLVSNEDDINASW